MANPAQIPISSEIALPRSPGRNALRSNVRASLLEGSAFSLMVGMGETYLPAFVLWMGLGDVVSGLVTTLPLLAGSLLQLMAPYLLCRVGSYRNWVILCASVQAAVFLPLVAAALLGHLPLWLVFACASLYWGAGLAASGAWNSWMGTLIPHSVQVGFFTVRTRLTQGMVFGGFVAGGVALYWLPRFVNEKWAYVGLFAGAFLCRAVSIGWLHKQSEPVSPRWDRTPALSWAAVAQTLNRGQERGKLFTYLFGVTFSAHLAAPYFTSYMLGPMALDYSSYAVLISASYLAKILFLPMLGRMASNRGTRPLMLLGGVGIVVLPLLWLFSQWIPYLVVIQAFSGFSWAAYELATLLLIWELVRPEERGVALTIYNTGNSFAMALGSVLGGALLFGYGGGVEAFTLLFLVSTVARAATLVWLGGISTQGVRTRLLGFRTLSLRPSLGSVSMPIMAQIRNLRGRRAPGPDRKK